MQEGREELLHVQGQEGGGEEIPLIQGKEQRLRFAGAAVTRYPTSGPITSWKIEGEKVEAVTYFLFLGSKITVDSDCSHEIRR